MPKTRQQKEEVVRDLAEQIKNMKSVVFANYEGLTVQEIQDLRKQCKDEDVLYTVAKKTLVKRAFADAKLDIDPSLIEGNFATVMAMSDEVAPARILAKFAKDHEALSIKGGIFEGKMVETAQVIVLSKLPSKEELLAKMVGSINAPVSGFVNVLAGNLRGFVQVLSQIKEAKV